MHQIQNDFQKIKDQYNRKLGELESLRNRKEQCELKISELTSQEELYAKTSLFLQSLSDTSRVEVLGRISQIVTDALQTVKDKNLSFVMDLVNERNIPTLKMGVFDKLTGQIYDVVNSFGGGIGDLIAFLLRIILIARWEPRLSRVIIADESLKFVSQKDQEVLAEFIKQLCHKLDIQLILITHSEKFFNVSDKIFEVTKENGISHVSEKTAL